MISASSYSVCFIWAKISLKHFFSELKLYFNYDNESPDTDLIQNLTVQRTLATVTSRSGGNKVMWFSGTAEYIDFGNQRHWCFDNLDMCPNGHVLSFLLNLPSSTRDFLEYIFSSGAMLPSLPGLSATYQYNSTDEKIYMSVDYVKRSRVEQGPIVRVSCTHWHLKHVIPTSVFVQIVIRWSPGGELTLFFDGQPVASGSGQVAPCADSIYNFYIGKRTDRMVYADYGRFYLDEFKFFDGQLTANEIRTL